MYSDMRSPELAVAGPRRDDTSLSRGTCLMTGGYDGDSGDSPDW